MSCLARNARGITSSPLTRVAFERLLVLTQREPFVSRTIPHLAAGDGSSSMLFLRLCSKSVLEEFSIGESVVRDCRRYRSRSVFRLRRDVTSTRRDSIDDSADVRDAARSIVLPFSLPVFGGELCIPGSPSNDERRFPLAISTLRDAKCIFI